MSLKIAVRAFIHHFNNGLVIIRRAEGTEHGKWCLPGGKVNPNETSDQAMIREIDEELGLIINPEYLFSDKNNADWLTHYYEGISCEKVTSNPAEVEEVGYIKELHDVNKLDFAFDHKEITKRYLVSKER